MSTLGEMNMVTGRPSSRRALTHGRATLALSALLIVASTMSASADDGSICPASILAWVARAGRAAGVPTRAERCSPHSVVLRLETRDAAPLYVEVRDDASRAFRHIGSIGISPMTQVDDWRSTAAERREPFDRLMAWVASHPDAVVMAARDTEPRGVWSLRGVGFSGAWLLVGALVLWVACRDHSGGDANDRSAALAAFIGALAMRAYFGLYGPVHINGQGPIWIEAAAQDATELASYGTGYVEFFGPLIRHLPCAPDTAIFAINIGLSSLVPALALFWGRNTGLDRTRAAMAAAMLALGPVAVRTAASEAYFPLTVALTMSAACVFLDAARAYSKGSRSRCAGLMVAAGLLSAEAARVHPTAWPLVALAPLSIAAVDGLMSAKVRSGLTLAAMAAGGGATLLTSAPMVLGIAGGMASGELHRPSLDLSWVKLLLIACVALAVFAVRPLRARAALGAVHVVVGLMLRDAYAQSDAWRLCFDQLFVAVPAVALASLVPEPLARRRGFLPASVALIAFASAFVLPTAYRDRTTEQLEYAWSRERIGAVSADCRIVYVGRADPRVLRLPTYLGAPRSAASIIRLDAQDELDASRMLGRIACTYYVRTSLCSSREGRPACDAIEHQLVLARESARVLPARPSYSRLFYDRRSVEVSFSRVVAYAAQRHID